MIRDPVGRAAALMVMVLAAGCDLADTAFSCPPGPDGAPVVASSGPGEWERRGLRPRLAELWRVGGLEEGHHLGYPAGFSVRADGRIAIPDFQLGEVIVIGADGTWLGSWGRRGRGPGELMAPGASAWGPDGELVVFDIGASKVLFLREREVARQDLPVAREITLPLTNSGEIEWLGAQPDGGVLLRPGLHELGGARAGESRVDLLMRVAPGVSSPDTLAVAVVRTLPGFPGTSLPGEPRVTATVAADGKVAVAGTDPSYRITILEAGGAPLSVICRDAAPLPVSERERGAGLEGDAERIRALQNTQLTHAPAAVGRLFWSGTETLWIQRERPSVIDGEDKLWGVPGAAYDVIRTDGVYLGEVRAPEGVRLQGAVEDRVWGFISGDFDEIWVVAYRLALE